MSFKVGDMVFVTRAGHHCYGKYGSVKNFLSQDSENIGVEFDEAVPGCHNINGHSVSGRGYYMSSREMIKMLPLSNVMEDFCNKELKKKKRQQAAESIIIIEEICNEA